MVALGFGKFARADRIFALERITGEERGDGRRTRVWIDGVDGSSDRLKDRGHDPS